MTTFSHTSQPEYCSAANNLWFCLSGEPKRCSFSRLHTIATSTNTGLNTSPYRPSSFLPAEAAPVGPATGQGPLVESPPRPLALAATVELVPASGC